MSTMATTEIDELRGLTDLAEDEYTDMELQTIITSKGSVRAAARYIWQTKAAATASLIDVSESGSSRNMSQIHKQALTMVESLADPVTDLTTTVTKTSRRAVRR